MKPTHCVLSKKQNKKENNETENITDFAEYIIWGRLFKASIA